MNVMNQNNLTWIRRGLDNIKASFECFKIQVVSLDYFGIFLIFKIGYMYDSVVYIASLPGSPALAVIAKCDMFMSPAAKSASLSRRSFAALVRTYCAAN